MESETHSVRWIGRDGLSANGSAPGPQHFADRPGLGDASSGSKWRVAPSFFTLSSGPNYFTGELNFASPRFTSANAHQITTFEMLFTYGGTTISFL